MDKIKLKPSALVYPLPAALVSCGAVPGEYNIITIAWTGTLCTKPPMCYVSIRPERHSYGIIKKTGQFVINLTNAGLAFAADWCGMNSGRDFDKFRELNLTAVKAEKINAPLIAESPVNIECIVKEIKELGVHHMFIAEVVNIHASGEYVDPLTGRFDLASAGLVSYIDRGYYKTGEKLGDYGFSKC